MIRILLFLFLLSGSVYGQMTEVVFQPILEGQELVLEGADVVAERSRPAKPAAKRTTGAKSVETLRFYISNLQLLRNGDTVFTEDNSYHLLDAEAPSTLRLPLRLPTNLDYDELVFTLGVDSIASSAGAFSGDLDPTKGMYWTWRSGYINFKLEGTSPECPARKHRFQFHVGGFQAPFNSIRTIRLAVNPADEIAVAVDLDRFLKKIDLRQQYQVMSPTAEAMEMADLLVEMFEIRK
jgi:hypothetical protein